MNKIEIGTKVFSYASEWNELTNEQLIEFARLYTKGLKEYDFKLKFFSLLSGIELGILKKFDEFDLVRAVETIDFLFRKSEKGIHLDVQLTKNLIPKILDYVGPISEFDNLSFIEFVNAHSAYIAFAQTWETEYLDRLVAILYRERAKKMNLYDLRVKYEDASVDERIKRIANVSYALKLCVFFYFEGCMNYVQKEFPALFKRSEEETETENEYGFLGILFDISGDKFGDFDKTAEQNLFLILSYLDNNLKKQKK